MQIFNSQLIHLQETAYQAPGNESGAVVVIDPNNGEILVVTKPSYDPNLFVDGTLNIISRYCKIKITLYLIEPH